MELQLVVLVTALLYLLGSSRASGYSTRFAEGDVTVSPALHQVQNASTPPIELKELSAFEKGQIHESKSTEGRSTNSGEFDTSTPRANLQTKSINTKVSNIQTADTPLKMAKAVTDTEVIEGENDLDLVTNEGQHDASTGITTSTDSVSVSSITPLPPTNYTVSGTVADINVTTTIKEKPQEPDVGDKNTTSGDEGGVGNKTELRTMEPTEFFLIGEVIRGCSLNMFCIDKCRPEQKASPNVGDDEGDYRDVWEYEEAYKSRLARAKRNIYYKADRNDMYDYINEYSSILDYEPSITFRAYDAYSRNLRLKRGVIEKKEICLNESLLGEPCSCDNQCVIYGDCCADVFESCMNFTKTEEIINFISNFRNSFKLGYNLDDVSNTIDENPEDGSKIAYEFLKTYGTCNTDINNGLHVVGLCPRNSTDLDEKENCEHQIYRLLPPVTATFSNIQIHFQNVFCARCHEMDESRLTAWTPEMICDQSVIRGASDRLTLSELDELVKAGLCNVTFQMPSGVCKPRKCSPSSSLSEDVRQDIEAGVKEKKCTTVDELLCKTYNFPGEGYKNPHCRKCLGASDRSKRDAENNFFSCGKITEEEDPDYNTANNIEGGILIILDLAGKYTTRRGNKNRVFEMCPETEVFDPLTQDCKRLLCSLGFEPYKGECVPVKEDFFVEKSTQMFASEWKKVQMNVQLQSISFDQCNQLILDIDKFQLNYFTAVTTVIVNGGVDSSKDKDTVSNGFLLKCRTIVKVAELKGSIHVKMLFELNDAVSVKAMSELSSLTEYITNNIVELVESAPVIQITNRINISQAICPAGRSPKIYTDFRLETYRDAPYAVINSTEFGIYFPLGSIGYDIKLSTGINDSVEIAETITACEVAGNLSADNCSTVIYWRNQTFLNGSVLLILDSGRYYQAGKYEIHGELIYVCSELEFEIKEIGSDQNLPYRICSYLLTGISSLFLITMLIVYILFPELRTLPGKMTASLAGSMLLTFLFNLVTLEDVYNEYVCPFLAAIAHLVTLAHFGWMSAIAVDMALTFGSRGLNPIRKMKDDDAFVRYGAVVWGLSAAVVTTSVVLDAIHPDERPTSDAETNEDDEESEMGVNYPRYGYPLCAWFSGPLWSKLAFIFVPYAITFLINIIGFVTTLVGIRKASVNAERVGKKSTDRARCLIYIKLSTAMGFTWLLSVLISSFPENRVLPYISLVLVLLQGLLLFLAFMANKRVSSLVVNRFKLQKLYSNTTQRSGVVNTDSV